MPDTVLGTKVTKQGKLGPCFYGIEILWEQAISREMSDILTMCREGKETNHVAEGNRITGLGNERWLFRGGDVAVEVCTVRRSQPKALWRQSILRKGAASAGALGRTSQVYRGQCGRLEPCGVGRAGRR